ncbi:hypothetical protein JOF56_004820 [Kibdelosporangium banguiense]|uniref:Uncharacterized protein n=1 Tax=Kibdelosporangium banguiense TaxID=1365924 RepID=A0ABS4TJ50_9PSEU|nr:hypothetical protein [Kibdelosporangium banguiense]
MQGADVDGVELDAVAHHQRDRVAPADAERGESGGNSTHLGRVLLPGEGLCVAGGSDRDRVRVDRGGRLERGTEGGGHLEPPVYRVSRSWMRRWRLRSSAR